MTAKEKAAHCDCVKRMNSVLYNHPQFDFAIVNAIDEDLPDWATAFLVKTTCTTCGAEFYVGRIGELMLSIETSAKRERDEARGLAEQYSKELGFGSVYEARKWT